MLGLPLSTEVKRPLPKAQLYRRFDWAPSQRESFDGDVARLDFVNWISPRTLPAIAEGTEIKEIFVIEVSLKSRDFDQKNVVLLAKSIPQRIIYFLRFEDEAMLVVYHTKLFCTPWQSIDSLICEKRTPGPATAEFLPDSIALKVSLKPSTMHLIISLSTAPIFSRVFIIALLSVS